MASVTDGGI